MLAYPTALAEMIASRLRDVPDFPQPGVLFKDITPLLADASALAEVTEALAALVTRTGRVDLVAGVEARGFVVAAAMAVRVGAGMIPVRKAGKLPPPTLKASYDLEYGSAEIEVPLGLLQGRSVFLVDDVLATGGTMVAAADLLESAGARVVGAAVIVELGFLNGRARFAPRHVHSLLTL